MGIIIPGRLGILILFLLFNGVILYTMWQARQGKKFKLRRTLEALEFIPEAIGRAVEMNKPIHYTPGGSGLSGARGTHMQMGFVIFAHVARLCARLGAGLIMSVWQGAQIPLAEELYRGAYAAEGIPDITPDVRFYSEDDPPYAAGCMGAIIEEGAVVNMPIGGAGSDMIFIAEGAAQLGCMQIGGSANVWMMPFVVAACDHYIIGEELFAAGAILSEDQLQISGIVGIDYNKIIIIAIILLGLLMNFIGNTMMLDFLNM